MLGKTANGLYWMYRYLERAQNTARLIETGQRIALTRAQGNDAEDWLSVLQTAGVADAYHAHHDTITRQQAIDWMLRSPDNPSSVRANIAAARQNGRLVRTALTTDLWEALNSCYLRSESLLKRKLNDRELSLALGTIRERTALVAGATEGTMLRNDIFNFTRLGTCIERADNTARILDVKYYVLLPSVSMVGTSLDNVQWEILLRSVSARGGYRLLYGAQPNPLDIARFMILDQRLPRSLSYCLREICANLRDLAEEYEQEPASLALAAQLDRKLLGQPIEQIFDDGLHEYLQTTIQGFADLGRQIEQDYRFYA